MSYGVVSGRQGRGEVLVGQDDPGCTRLSGAETAGRQLLQATVQGTIDDPKRKPRRQRGHARRAHIIYESAPKHGMTGAQPCRTIMCLFNPGSRAAACPAEMHHTLQGADMCKVARPVRPPFPPQPLCSPLCASALSCYPAPTLTVTSWPSYVPACTLQPLLRPRACASFSRSLAGSRTGTSFDTLLRWEARGTRSAWATGTHKQVCGQGKARGHAMLLCIK